MAGPATIEDYQTSTWSGTATGNEVTPSITWLAGDLIVVVGVTENAPAVLGTPTATGLTFAAVTGSPQAGASNTWVGMWTATAAGDGSGAVTSAPSGDTTSLARGIAAFVVRNHNGAGTPATINNSSAKTISLTTVDSSSVVIAVFADWNAAAVGTAASPTTNGTLRQAVLVSGRATFHLVSWTTQGAATTSYGYSGGGTPDNNGIVVEVKGTAAAGGRTTRNTRAFPLGTEIGMGWVCPTQV